MSRPVFVAVGYDGLRMLSEDGRSWGSPMLGQEGEVLRSAVVGNGRVVAVGTRGGDQVLIASVDGVKWTRSRREGGYGGYLRTVQFDGRRFLGLGGDPGAVGAANPYVLLSDDGVNWEGPHRIGGKFLIRRIAFGEGIYVGVGDRGRRAWSRDAIHWEDVPDVKPLETLIDIAHGGGAFVGVGLHGLRWRTLDGRKWLEPIRGEEGEHLNSIVWNGDRFVAVGQGATYLSADGLKWERRANREAPTTVCHYQGVFLGAKWKGRLQASRDGIVWEPVARVDRHIEAVAAGRIGSDRS